MFSSVTLVVFIRTVNNPFLFMQVDLNKKAFGRREIMTQQFGWDIFPYVQHNSSTISIIQLAFREAIIKFVSDTTKTSMKPLICSLRISNLFLKELAFRCPNINLLILLIRIFLRDFLTTDCKAVESSDVLYLLGI